MATDVLLVEPESLIVAVLVGLGAAVGLALVAFLVAWAWQLPGRRVRRLEREHAEALQEAHRATSQQAHLAGKAQKDVEALEAELERLRLELATRQAALEEARQQGSRVEAKALQAVQDARAKEAALAAKAQRLGQDLTAATDQATQALEAYGKLSQETERLQARHNETVEDLRKLRDCGHQEQATVYTRETDPATRARPYRSQGQLCKQCRYVLPATANGQAEALPVLAATNA